MFVGGRLHPDLSDHRRRLGGVRGEQVNARRLAVAAAPQRLAVQREVLPPGGVAVGQPLTNQPIKVIGIQLLEQQREGIGAGHRATSEPQSVPQSLPA